MSLNIRIDEATHATLKELAEKDDASLQEEVRRAVEAYRRERFFAELSASYARMTPEQRAEEAAELALWDVTLPEDWSDFEAQ